MITEQHPSEIHDSEQYWLHKTAEEYRSKGYDVSLESQLDFLPDLRADIVAIKNGDRRVVEVKRRTALRADTRVERLAQAIDSAPGWSFDLVLIPEPDQLAAPEGSVPLSTEAALSRADVAEQLLRSGQREPSLLTAWSACEALLRARLRVETGIRDDMSPTSQLLNSATMHGIMAHTDLDCLRELLRLRNAVAHGMSHASIGDAEVLRLIELVRAVSSDTPSDQSAGPADAEATA